MENTYNELIRNLKSDVSTQAVLNVALLADFSAQHLAKALRAAAKEKNIDLHLWEAEYDSVFTNVYDANSDLYAREFDYIVIFQSTQKLYREYSYRTEKQGFSEEKLISIKSLVSLLRERSNAKVILSNYAELDDRVFGNFANKTSLSFLYHLRKLNVDFMELAMQKKNLFINDVQNLVTSQGVRAAVNPQQYIHADLVFDLDFLALLARNTMQIILAVQGSFKKCVILDLDNTLWGGIIGDDGMQNIQVGDLGLGKAFTNLQLWLKNLKERGIILAVCSKNTEEIAKEPFLKHPGMVLRLQDIAVFVANWETKVDNINFIQSVLNIGFDSMVFVDDNPFERSMVRQHIPGIVVPELPGDPSEYVPFLQRLNLFEVGSFSETDAVRTKQYQEEAKRAVLQKSFASEAEFLGSLQMTAEVRPIDDFILPRVAQLSQRSNQFNLRTVRYTEEDVSRIMKDPRKFALTVTLKDIFGDYGLISAVILEKETEDRFFIDTWIMSCRVLKRGVEKFLLNEIVQLAREQEIRFIEGEYIPTAKNGLVKDHYLHLGFEYLPEKNRWLLATDVYQHQQTSISKTGTYVKHERDS